ncbi:DUF4145 domain-containing protein [Helicobacter saguini]|uniref:DUF4145 domain-containing protein n=1 Tax=Helicobacter saguini TaxID=1548018 RepID=A0A347VZX4_9HELI|nr:DUF4145 domain-containing protein [Helicobacter saguini]MWV62983.1 DUF4145 domain-containing protein [Helicobacter saguini]MWV66348.1 DUF4145 domain-containing protein [Helicobacter saguini]MWV68700.1 DUF4145 domain-containing protein [Helicobacter saguini]MWV71749.1 DUF4145 domain-containing protein [Helicobacter saguini]TLD91615.1 DUF4145 domain-containing protein [Helicobacter saguini]
MNNKFIEPQFGITPFTCPHCQVVAQMEFIDPRYINECVRKNLLEIMQMIHTEVYQALQENIQNKINNINKIMNYNAKYAYTYAVCQNCKEINIWVDSKMIYPKPLLTPLPNEYLPKEIKEDYEEASLILQDSPRGACALLRLALQKIMIELGEDRNLNKAIQSLIDKKTIDKYLQKALDSVRVIGNNAVHPNELDMKDNKEIATRLFNIINYIAEKTFADRKRIDEIYNILPENAKRKNDK